MASLSLPTHPDPTRAGGETTDTRCGPGERAMVEDLLTARLAPFESSHASACRAVRHVAADRLLRDAVMYLLETEPGYIETIAPLLESLERFFAARHQPFDKALEAFSEYTYVYVRHQVDFLATGNYSHQQFDEVYKKVYDNEELMSSTYLPGLYLTQLFWPVHYRVLSLFRTEFLGRVARPPQAILEVGVGHGMTLLHTLRAFPGRPAFAIDVSAPALRFTKELLDGNGIETGSCRFLQLDATREPAADVQAEIATMG